MERPDQIGEIYVISRMLKLYGHYVWVHTGRSAKAVSDIEKAIDPVLVFIRGTKHIC